jgi:hypothetical protein
MNIQWIDVMKRLPNEQQICVVIGGKYIGDRESLCFARYLGPDEGWVSLYKSKFFCGIIIKKSRGNQYLHQSKFYTVSLWAPIAAFMPYLEYTFSRNPGLLSEIESVKMTNITYKELTHATQKYYPNLRRRGKNYYVGDDSGLYPKKTLVLDDNPLCQRCNAELNGANKGYWSGDGIGICSTCVPIKKRNDF